MSLKKTTIIEIVQILAAKAVEIPAKEFSCNSEVL